MLLTNVKKIKTKMFKLYIIIYKIKMKFKKKKFKKNLLYLNNNIITKIIYSKPKKIISLFKIQN